MASIYDECFDYVVWNEPYASVRHAPRQPAQHALDDVHRPANRICLVHWESAARTVLSQCRAAAGRHPGNPRFAEIVEALSEASPQFRDWWAAHPIDYFRPAIVAVRHPGAGLIQLEMFQLRLVNQPILIMVIQVPSNQTYLARVNSLLQP